MELRRKLTILADAAKYDASCASSGAKGRNCSAAKASARWTGPGSPRLHAGRALRLPAQDPAHQLVHVRLRLLREPQLQQRAACPVHRSGSGPPHHRLLQAQLYRRALLSSDNPQRRLHDGATRRRRPDLARGARLPRLHPLEDHPRGRSPAGRGRRPLCRPAELQHRAAARAGLARLAPQKSQGAIRRTMAATRLRLEAARGEKRPQSFSPPARARR